LLSALKAFSLKTFKSAVQPSFKCAQVLVAQQAYGLDWQLLPEFVVFPISLTVISD
jgi:hypothetical protein